MNLDTQYSYSATQGPFGQKMTVAGIETPKSGMARADSPHLKLVTSYLMTGPSLVRACTCNSQGCGDELCTNEKIEAP